MNRIIKFRGQRLNNGEPTNIWVFGSLRCDYGAVDSSSLFSRCETPDIYSVGIRACEIYDPKTYSTYAVNSNTVGQFTGLLDCHGTEIYEGDILLCKGKHLYQVEWLTDGFMIRGKTYGGITSIKSFLPIQREVEGNIFDNPELIKKRLK
ncbi:MAG: hypothetical protein HDR09_21685 [Lachnospiraceae bacterium]|nr:hypothetical protein [Lachnospiraceae bacterium]